MESHSLLTYSLAWGASYKTKINEMTKRGEREWMDDGVEGFSELNMRSGIEISRVDLAEQLCLVFVAHCAVLYFMYCTGSYHDCVAIGYSMHYTVAA